MAITWPSTLPVAPTYNGFTEQPPNNSIRTEMDEGPAKVRLRKIYNTTRFTVGFELTATETGYLDTFYRTTTVYGTLEYEWTHPRLGTTHSFRMVTQPIYSNLGGDLWAAQFTVEQMP